MYRGYRHYSFVGWMLASAILALASIGCMVTGASAQSTTGGGGCNIAIDCKAKSLTLATPLSVANGGTGGTASTGTGLVVLNTNPTLNTPILVNPNLGTPSNINLTNATNLPPLGAATATSLALNGATIGSNALAVTGTSQLGGAVTLGGNLVLPSGGVINWTNRGSILQSVDGVYTFSNNAGTNLSTMTVNAGGNVTFGGSIISSAAIVAAGGSSYQFSGRSNLSAPVDSQINFNNNGATSTVKLGFANNTWLLGGLDAAAPSAQLVEPQAVLTGTSDTAGANLTIAGGIGTGAGLGGSLIFQVAPAGTTGSAKNALATALTIDSTKAATFAGQIGNPGATIFSNGNALFNSVATNTISGPSNGASDLTIGGLSSNANLKFRTNNVVNWTLDGATGNIYAATDNTYNIGATSASRPANIYAGSTITAGGNITTSNGSVFVSSNIGEIFLGATSDVKLSRAGAANLRLGDVDLAAPVAQTLSVQNVVAGTTNTAGANVTIAGSRGTGTGLGGSIIFQVAPAGSTGSTQNALATAMSIDSTKNAAFFGLLQVGGSTSGFPALKRNGARLETRLADDSNYADIRSYNVIATTGQQIYWSGSSGMGSATDGNITLYNNASTSFGLLQFGGTTSGFPAIKRSLSTLQVRLADDSAYADLAVNNITVNGTCTGCAGGTVPKLQADSTTTSGTSAPSWAKLYLPAFTANDTATAGSNSIVSGYWLDTPTLTATNARTYTSAASLYVNNAPTCSTNTTCTAKYAILAGSGDIATLSGNITTSSGTVSGLFVSGGFVTGSLIKTTPTTLSSISAYCGVGSGGGYRGFVTDSTVTAYGATVAGSSTNHVPVWCDDVAGVWKVG